MLNKIGQMFAQLGRPDSALAYYRGALPLALEFDDRLGAATAINNIGQVYSGLGQPDSALAYSHEALVIIREIGARAIEGTALNNIGLIYTALGQADSALAYYGDALPVFGEAGDRKGIGTALNNIGQVYSGLGQADSALVYTKEALAIAREVSDRVGEGRAVNNIGLAYAALGYPDSALVYYRTALPIVREVGDRAGEGRAVNNIGLTYSALGQPDSALAYMRDALVIIRGLGDRAVEGRALSNIGLVHAALEQPDSALAHYRRALPILREVGDRVGEGLALNNIGQVFEGLTLPAAFAGLSQPDSALSYYRQGLAVAREVGNRSGEATALNNIGSAYAGLGRADSALAHYREALPIFREIGERMLEGGSLSNIAYTTHRFLARPDLPAVLAYYDSAAAVLGLVAGAAGSDLNRLSYAEQDVYLYQEWALAWLARGAEVGTEAAGSEAAALAALAASERGRSQALLDLMRGTAQTQPGRDMTAEGHDLISPLVGSGVTGLSWLVTQDTMLTWLIRPGGEVRVARRPIARDSVEVLVSELRYGLGVDEAAREARLAGGGTARLEGARGSESRRRGGAPGAWPSESALRLSELLLPDEFVSLLPAFGELVLVPHGPLNLIPFATLPIGEQTERQGSEELLGARYALRFAPSLATLGEATMRSGAARAGDEKPLLAGTLVVGNPAMPEVSGPGGSVALSPLPGAEAEGRWVADLVGTELLSGPGATEQRVREQLPHASVIHLATHGFAYSSEARARDSFVALAPDGEHDGLLTVGEVLDDPALRLAAELVVLSACQTGLGDLKQSEGTVGLQRAFLAKGARSVLVSLWSVSDEATDLLMRGFYTHWLEDEDAPSKAEALRRAQEDVRATPGFEHPRFWAAFQLVGAR
jgi:tetratricopeptide (TPR) repeat protein